MRALLTAVVVAIRLAAAPLGFLASQPPVKDAKPDVEALKLEFPAKVAVGEEFTVTAPIRNNVGELRVYNLRLGLLGQYEVVVPDAEQIVILEANATRMVKWRVKRTGPEAGSIYVESTPLDLGKPRPVTPGARLDAADEAALSKTWKGMFTDKRDNEYRAVVNLQFSADKTLHGRIEWTLTKSKRDDYQAKIGLAGIEFVWGLFDADKRLLTLEGYRRDDPHRILGLDKYMLSLAKDGARLGGSTWDHGNLDGRLDLMPMGK
jgi:hypothetical protein